MPRPHHLLLRAALAIAALSASLPALGGEPPPADAPPEAAPPRGKHCLYEPSRKILLSHTLAVQVNPLGAEHQLQLALCVPLFKKPGALYDLTNFEVGVSNYLSPSYVHQGGFVGITPLSLLQLKAELAGVYVWTIPIRGAGYYDFPSYHADFSEDARPKGEGDTAGGYVLSMSATLRGRIGPTDGAGLLIADTLLAERWSLGDGPYYYNLRRDILLESSDWLVRNNVALLVEIPLSSNVSTRICVVDETTVAPDSSRTTNILAGLATLRFRRVGTTFNDLQPFVRLGGHTHHASANQFRTGEPNLLIGVNTVYEIAKLDP